MATQTSPNINAERIQGHLQLSASTTLSSQLNLIVGTAPSVPLEGDIFRTSSRIFIYDHLSINNDGTGALRIGHVNTSNPRDVSIYRNANGTVGIAIENNTAGTANFVNINFGNSSTNGFGNADIGRFDYNYSGNFDGTSIPARDAFMIQNYVGNAGALGSAKTVYKNSAVINIPGTTATNFGTRVDAFGLRIGQIADLHNANTVEFEVGGNAKIGGSIYASNNSYALGGAGPVVVADGSSSAFALGYTGDAIPHIRQHLGALYLQGTGSGYGVYVGQSDFHVNGNVRVGDSTLNTGYALEVSGKLQVTTQAGTGDRMVEADSTGVQSATKEIISAWITDSTAISILTDPANWSVSPPGWITPSPELTDTYQGQMYSDGVYFYIMIADNTPIRLQQV